MHTCATWRNFQNFCILLAQCIIVFYILLIMYDRPKPHEQTGLCNGDGVCSL